MEKEIRTWLKTALVKENLSDFDVKILGNSGLGDGYVGDIKFIEVSGHKQGSQVNYNLALKCSKDSQLLRDKLPIKDVFDSEILVYDTIIPAFTKFQLSKNLTNTFQSIPKYYGHYRSSTREIIVLEDLKKIGYDLWNKYLPLPRKHIELILTEYGKWHAISVAMQDQEPQNFKEITKDLSDIYPKFAAVSNFNHTYIQTITNTFPLFENEFSKEMMEEWRQFIEQIPGIVDNIRKPGNYLAVVAHADCWNNNFLFKSKESPEKVAILDWQCSALISPVIDISYFLYTCISKEDLQDFDKLLKLYYQSFSDYVRQLGSDPEQLYSLAQLQNDWLKFAKFGILMCVFGVKATLTPKEDSPDLIETVKSDITFGEAFLKLKPSPLYKERIQCVIEHALKRGIIKNKLF